MIWVILFIIILNLATLYTIFLFLYLIHKKIKYKKISKYPLPPVIKKKIFIDRSFTQLERKQIKKALLYWGKITHGIVRLYLVEPFSSSLDEGIQYRKRTENEPCFNVYIGKILSSNEAIKNIDKYENGKIVGYCFSNLIPNIILLVVDRINSNLSLMNITIHEIGHSLGIRHSDDKNSLMYYYHHNDAIITKENLYEIINNANLHHEISHQ